MRFLLLWVILLVPLVGTAYADVDFNLNYVNTVSDSLDGFIDTIINTMNPIFNLVFNLQNNERIQQWGDEIIQKQADMTEKQITDQLGHDPKVTCC